MPSLLRRLDIQALPEASTPPLPLNSQSAITSDSHLKDSYRSGGQVLAVLEHANLFEATASLLQVEEVRSGAFGFVMSQVSVILKLLQVVTTAYKWLRAVPPTTYTGPHMDRAYVGEGRRLTAWIPFGPVRRGHLLGSLTLFTP